MSTSGQKSRDGIATVLAAPWAFGFQSGFFFGSSSKCYSKHLRVSITWCHLNCPRSQSLSLQSGGHWGRPTNCSLRFPQPASKAEAIVPFRGGPLICGSAYRDGINTFFSWTSFISWSSQIPIDCKRVVASALSACLSQRMLTMTSLDICIPRTALFLGGQMYMCSMNIWTENILSC